MQSSNESDFYLEQISTGCLALFSYYLESNQEAIVIDPLRETDGYIALANKRGAKIKYIFETHFHADFVSGHVDLAKKTGATIVYGPTAKPSFDFKEAKDGEEIPLGKIKIKVLHTPGHTPESSCYLLINSEGKPYCVFTGDTLFLGEVGRPDLAVKGNEITEKDLAGWMYDSLRNKIMTLDDNVIIYPAHGAGSSCGKSIQAGNCDTLGNQKKTNYALQPMTKEEFVTIVTSGITKPPGYFFHDVNMNKSGYEELDKVLERSLKPLSLEEFKKAVDEGALILDTRNTDDIKKSYAVGSLCISLQATFASWSGALIKPETKIVLITPEGKEKESIVRLARVGYENVLGYLEGGFDTWVKAGNPVESWKFIEAEELKKKLEEKPHILDIRNRHEWETGVIDGAILLNMNEIINRYDELPKDGHLYVHCRSGQRSFPTYTLLRKLGFDAIEVKGGILAIGSANIPLKIPTL